MKNQKIDLIDQNSLAKITKQLAKEVVSQVDPSEIFKRDGIFEQLKKQIIETVLVSELEHDLATLDRTK